MNEANDLAKKKGIVLEYDKKGIYNKKKQIWYKYDDGNQWLWFATSWTAACKRLKELGRKKI